MPSIVTVNVSLTQAPTPSTLQGTGAFISQGATTTTPGTKTLLTQLSSLATYLKGNFAVTSLTQSGGTATATIPANGFTVGDQVYLTIAGATPAAYNGTFLCTITASTTFTYAVPAGTSTPATGTIVYTEEDVAELNAMNTTFFAQGTATGVYVLECGIGSPTEGANFLATWIANNPGVFYSYLVPRTWDSNAAFLSLIASYEATTSITYFWVTTTLATYQNYTSLMKDVVTLIESPYLGVYAANALTAISYSAGFVTATTTTAHGVLVGQWFQIAGVTPTGYNGWWQAVTGTTGTTLVYAVPTALGTESVLGTLVGNQYANPQLSPNEFSLASAFNVALSYNPTAINLVPPLTYAFVFGVTPFPTAGFGSLLTTLQSANTNIIGTGAEGGISNTIFLYGTTEDGNVFNFWYAIDWLNINTNLNVSNAVINGSNTNIAPLYYNQAGINTLQSVGARTIQDGITFGLIFGSLIQTELSSTQFAANIAAGQYNGYAVINAIPLPTYSAANPSAYKQRTYGGFQVAFTPQNGFETITFNLNASQFVG